MIKLSDRLQTIANQMNTKETMADIGTDHGFLPIYLWENQISPKVIMADISRGSLNKAQENCTLYYPHTKFDLRLGNGIQILENNEVDAVVIAGIGGALMTEILGDNLKKTKSFPKFILQPRNGQGKLRKWLLDHEFEIMNESLAKEGKYICEIITAKSKKQTKKQSVISEDIDLCKEISYEVPPWIWSAGALAEELIKNKLRIEEEILKNMGKAAIKDERKQQNIQNRIYYLKNLLKGAHCI